MSKKLYNNPLIEVMLLNTELMQHVSSTSEGNNQCPDGPAGAPFNPRRTEVF